MSQKETSIFAGSWKDIAERSSKKAKDVLEEEERELEQGLNASPPTTFFHAGVSASIVSSSFLESDSLFALFSLCLSALLPSSVSPPRLLFGA